MSRARKASVALLLGGVALGGAHCRTATEIVLEIRTNAPCVRVRSTAVLTGRTVDDFDTRGAAAMREGCETPRGEIGTLVLTPSGADDGELAVQVTLGLGRAADTCSTTDRAGCVVARRALRFAPGKTTRVGIELDALCEGRVCATAETCEQGRCVGIAGLPPQPPHDDAGIVEPVPEAGPDGAPLKCEDVCASKGGRCDTNGVCEIDCRGPSKCSGNATLCPPGVPCRIVCDDGKRGQPACKNLMCPSGTPSCEFVCSGGEGCDGAITCEATSKCVVRCTAANACKLTAISVEAADNVIQCEVKDACKDATITCTPPGQQPRDCRASAAACGAPPCKCTLENGKPCG